MDTLMERNNNNKRVAYTSTMITDDNGTKNFIPIYCQQNVYTFGGYSFLPRSLEIIVSGRNFRHAAIQAKGCAIMICPINRRKAFCQ